MRYVCRWEGGAGTPGTGERLLPTWEEKMRRVQLVGGTVERNWCMGGAGGRNICGRWAVGRCDGRVL